MSSRWKNIRNAALAAFLERLPPGDHLVRVERPTFQAGRVPNSFEITVRDTWITILPNTEGKADE